MEDIIRQIEDAAKLLQGEGGPYEFFSAVIATCARQAFNAREAGDELSVHSLKRVALLAVIAAEEVLHIQEEVARNGN